MFMFNRNNMIRVAGTFLVALAHIAVGANFSTVTLAPNDPQVLHITVNESFKLTTKVTDNTRTSFYIFEIHTRDRELKLADDLIKMSHTTIGAHAGITVFPSTIGNATEAPYAFVLNDIQNELLRQVNVSFIALVREYPKAGPVPGICTKGDNNTINNRPALRITYSAEMGELSYSTSGFINLTSNTSVGCGKSDAQAELVYTIYQMYMDEGNLDEDYFLATLASSMLLREDIEKNGRVIDSGFVQRPDVVNRQRVLFALYPRTASVFAVVVAHPDNQTHAIYTGSATYGCCFHRTQKAIYYCEDSLSTKLIIIGVLCIGIGTLLLFASHRYFKTSLFTFSFLTITVISYVFLEVHAALYIKFEHAFISIMIGAIFGCLWVSVWKCFGSPLLSVLLQLVSAGYIVAFSIFFIPATNVMAFANDLSYWSTLSGVAVAYSLAIITFPKNAAIASGALIGSYTLIYGIDWFAGTHLKYILLNAMRRATISSFRLAVIAPPFQSNDMAVLVSWFVLFLLGTVVQIFREADRIPFPAESLRIGLWERAERVRENEENEARRPLLANEQQQQPGVSATATNSSRSPPPGASNAPPGGNYDSFYQAALLMAEAARNAQQAFSSAATAVNPNTQQREDASSDNPTTNESLAAPRIFSPAPEIPVIEVHGEATPPPHPPPSAPPPGYLESVASPPQRGASAIEEERLQTRSQDPFKPPTPPE